MGIDVKLKPSTEDCHTLDEAPISPVTVKTQEHLKVGIIIDRAHKNIISLWAEKNEGN